MAKPFYSMEEVIRTLGKSAEEIKALVRDGTLREFRDAGKVFFKAEDVDALRGAAAAASGKSGSGDIVLEPIDEDVPPAVDDPGKSDSITLLPADDDTESKKKDDTVITASGISVFDDDELEIDADPLAKTRIASAVGDEVALEGTGSGSGLLDLTREADDTSLGAELLDEIYPGQDEVAQRPAAAPAAAAVEEAPAEPLAEQEASAEVILAPITAGVDPSEPIFGGLLAGGLVLLALGASVVGGVLQGYLPSYATLLSDNFWFFVLGAILVMGLSTLIGWLVGRASVPRRG